MFICWLVYFLPQLHLNLKITVNVSSMCILCVVIQFTIYAQCSITLYLSWVPRENGQHANKPSGPNACWDGEAHEAWPYVHDEYMNIYAQLPPKTLQRCMHLYTPKLNTYEEMQSCPSAKICAYSHTQINSGHDTLIIWHGL